MGQSNMAGRGNLEDVETIRDENVFVFRMGSFISDQFKISSYFWRKIF